MANIVGIDLGTTFSALSALNAIGKPEIVPNADGERLTPSAIFFDEENSDLIRVGQVLRIPLPKNGSGRGERG